MMAIKNQTEIGADRPLSILRLVLSVGQTSASYNQFSLALAQKHEISICTYFRSTVIPPSQISLFEGDGSLKGFFSAMEIALLDKKYDVIHAHSPHVGFLYLCSYMLWPWNLRTPTVCTVHNSFSSYKKSRTKLLFLPVFALFQRVVCCSQASFESVPALYRWLVGRRLSAVQNGVDMERIDRTLALSGSLPSCLSHSDTEKFMVTSVGRLIDIKNPLVLFDAFQQSADSACRLLFIGEGPHQETLRTRSQALGMESQLELTGLISREQVYQTLEHTDLFVSTSKGEGLPIATLEAMACGCPVLLSDIPPHREIAKDVDFIPLIAPNDVAGFAREIQRFRQMSDGERTKIGQKCRQLVEARFSLSAMHEGYERIYAQLLANKYRPGSTTAYAKADMA